MFGVSKAPLSALSVSLKAVVLQNAVAQLRIYDVGALLVRKTVGDPVRCSNSKYRF